MSGYGKVISGGAKMSKGLTKGINDKLSAFAESHKRSATLANAVKGVFNDKAPLAGPRITGVNVADAKKFTSVTRPEKV